MAGQKMKTVQKNKATYHRGREGSAKHNEHLHLGDDKDIYVAYINKCSIEGKTLEENEMYFYEQNYKKMFDLQNEKHRAAGHKNRMKTLKQYHDMKNYRPIESILQYGHAGGEVPSRSDMIKMTENYIKCLLEASKNSGNHLHILSAVIHFDETTPHAQIRTIWDYTDDDGVRKIGQDEGMKLSGIELSDASKEKSQFNNRNMTFTNICRNLWYDICDHYGYQVDRVPDPSRPRHRSIAAYSAEREIELNERETKVADDEQRLKEEREDFEKYKTQEEQKLQNEREEFQAYKTQEEQKLQKREKNLEFNEREIKLTQDEIQEEKQDLEFVKRKVQEENDKLNVMIEQTTNIENEAKRFLNEAQELNNNMRYLSERDKELYGAEMSKKAEEQKKREKRRKIIERATLDLSDEMLRYMQQHTDDDDFNF